MSTYDDVDGHLDELRDKARQAIHDEAQASVELETDPVALAVHERRVRRFNIVNGEDTEAHQEIEDRVRQWLQDATRHDDADVRSMARRGLERFDKNSRKSSEPDGLELLTKAWRSPTENDRLHEYLAELPERLARPLLKSASAEAHSQRASDSLAALFCQKNRIPIGRRAAPVQAAPARKPAAGSTYDDLTKSTDPATRASARRMLESQPSGGRRR